MKPSITGNSGSSGAEANGKSTIDCLVLGGGGFIGSHLVEHLLQERLRVRVFIRPGSSHRKLGQFLGQVEIFEGEVQDTGAVSRAVAGSKVVFHLLGTTVPSSSNRDPSFDVETNLVATLKLLETCRRAGVKKVLFASSGGAVYGTTQVLPICEDFPTDPRSSYGIVKLAIEKYLYLYCIAYGLEYVVLRLGNVYGPRLPLGGEQNAVGVFLSRALERQPITIWGDGSAVRDYVYVTDVARAFCAAMRNRSRFRVFNIATSIGTSLKQLVEKIENLTAQKLSIQWEPSRDVDVSQNVLAVERARTYLNWQPGVDLNMGLEMTWKWLCSSRAASGTDASVR